MSVQGTLPFASQPSFAEIDALASLATTAHQEGRYEDEILFYDRILQVNTAEEGTIPPFKVCYLIYRSDAFRLSGKPERALDGLNEVLSLSPSHPLELLARKCRAAALVNLGQISIQAKDFPRSVEQLEEAQKDLDIVLREHPTDAAYKLREIALRNLGQGYLGLGKAQMNLGEKPEALRSLQLAAQKDPTNVDLLLGCGILAQTMNFHQEAIDLFTLVLENRPEAHRVLGSRGFSLLAVKNAEAALVDFNTLLSKEPSDLAALAGRGAALTFQENPASGLQDLQEALLRDPENILARTYRVFARLKTPPYTEEIEQEIISDLEFLLERNPKDRNALNFLNYLARRKIEQGRSAEAFAHWEHILQWDPTNSFALFYRGVAFFNRRNLEACLRDITLLLEKEPGHTAALSLRAKTYRLLEEYQKAGSDLERLLQLSPGHPGAQTDFALLKILTGDVQSGLTEIAAICQGNPSVYNRYVLAKGLLASGQAMLALCEINALTVAGAPQQIDLWHLKIEAEMALGSHKSALQACDAVLKSFGLPEGFDRGPVLLPPGSPTFLLLQNAPKPICQILKLRIEALIKLRLYNRAKKACDFVLGARPSDAVFLELRERAIQLK